MINISHSAAAHKHQMGIIYDQINSCHALSEQKSPRHVPGTEIKSFLTEGDCGVVIIWILFFTQVTEMNICTVTFVLAKSHCMHATCSSVLEYPLLQMYKQRIYMCTCFSHTTFENMALNTQRNYLLSFQNMK